MTPTAPRFPWARMMQLGLGVLRLSPHEFWASTPREIAAAFPPQRRSTCLSHDDFNNLMNRFPDEP